MIISSKLIRYKPTLLLLLHKLFQNSISSGSQRGCDADCGRDVGDREDHAPRAQQRDRDQEGDIRRDHRVAPGLQRVLTLWANIQNKVISIPGIIIRKLFAVSGAWVGWFRLSNYKCLL